MQFLCKHLLDSKMKLKIYAWQIAAYFHQNSEAKNLTEKSLC